MRNPQSRQPTLFTLSSRTRLTCSLDAPNLSRTSTHAPSALAAIQVLGHSPLTPLTPSERKAFSDILAIDNHVCTLDTAGTAGPWQPALGGTGKTFAPGKSKKGIDMGYYSCYKEKGNKWFFSSRRGGDAQRQGVRWLVKEWNGGQGNYMNPAATTFNQELSERDAGLRLIAFVEGLDVLETGVGGGCDSRRIN